jgi:predicted Zn-dependent peptidase
LYAQAGVDIDRIDDAVGTVAAELKKIAAEAVPQDELRKAKNFAKGRFVLQIESPHGLIMFGLRREVLEQSVSEPEEVLTGIEAVTAEDVQRIAQELIADRALRLAVIGPFEDAERFEKLLD